METLITLLLVVHIAGGMSGLLSGAFNIANKKGGKYHHLFGKIYVGGMFTATLSGIVLAFVRDNSFLFLIGVFSFYLAFSGYRTLSHKKLNVPGVYKPIDYIVATITALFAVVMLVLSVSITSSGNLSFNPLLIVFGSISLVYGLGDILIFRGIRKVKHPKNHWFFNHIIRMMASYISAVTAFLVVNVSVLPDLVIWLSPTVVGSILISVFVRKYQRKLGLG
jgi:hypothetical protein